MFSTFIFHLCIFHFVWFVQPGSTNLSPWQRRADRLKSLNSTDRLRPARFIAQQVQVICIRYYQWREWLVLGMNAFSWVCDVSCSSLFCATDSEPSCNIRLEDICIPFDPENAKSMDLSRSKYQSVQQVLICGWMIVKPCQNLGLSENSLPCSIPWLVMSIPVGEWPLRWYTPFSDTPVHIAGL